MQTQAQFLESILLNHSSYLLQLFASYFIVNSDRSCIYFPLGLWTPVITGFTYMWGCFFVRSTTSTEVLPIQNDSYVFLAPQTPKSYWRFKWYNSTELFFFQNSGQESCWSAAAQHLPILQTMPEASRTDLERGYRASKGRLPGREKTGTATLTTELKQQGSSRQRDGGGRGMQGAGRGSDEEDRRDKGNTCMKRNICSHNRETGRKLSK